MNARRAALGAQALVALAALAFAPSGWPKAVLLAAVWLLPHGRLSLREVVLFVAANALFIGMDVGAIRAGRFAFAHPSLAGLPAYEAIMWGGYLLHVHRFWSDATQRPRALRPRRFATVAALAVAFGACFPLVPDDRALLVLTSLAVGAAMLVGATRASVLCAFHMAVLGAAVECVGVAFGEWSYPGPKPFAIPPWFLSMWGGVGFFFASLTFPFVAARSAAGGAPHVDECISMPAARAATSPGAASSRA